MIARIVDSTYKILSPSLTSSQIEILKHIAIITMLISHVGVVFFSGEDQVYYLVGRIAFPLFAFLLVYNYIHNTHSPIRYIARILIVGILAQAPYVLSVGKGSDFLNIMFTLAVGLVIVHLLSLMLSKKDKVVKYALGYAAIGIFLAGGVFVDYIHLGLILIVAYWVWLRFPSHMTFYAAIGATFLLNFPSGYFYSIAGVSAIGFVVLVQSLEVEIPRLTKWYYYSFYPAHLMVLHILKTII